MTAAIDATDDTFATLVLDRSEHMLVVVELWASRCEPCYAFGPMLESLVAAREGAIPLARVDVGSNPRLASTFDVDTLPAV